jgi:hypothetical protein
MNVMKISKGITFGDLPGHEFHGNQWTGGGGSGVPQATHDKLVSAGFQAYNHGEGHQGYLDNTESKITTKAFNQHLRDQGYQLGRITPGTKMYDGFNHWTYQHPKAGAYATRTASFDSKGGKYVRSINFNNHVTRD